MNGKKSTARQEEAATRPPPRVFTTRAGGSLFTPSFTITHTAQLLNLAKETPVKVGTKIALVLTNLATTVLTRANANVASGRRREPPRLRRSPLPAPRDARPDQAQLEMLYAHVLVMNNYGCGEQHHQPLPPSSAETFILLPPRIEISHQCGHVATAALPQAQIAPNSAGRRDTRRENGERVRQSVAPNR